jgi:hypothetical protein
MKEMEDGMESTFRTFESVLLAWYLQALALGIHAVRCYV